MISFFNVIRYLNNLNASENRREQQIAKLLNNESKNNKRLEIIENLLKVQNLRILDKEVISLLNMRNLDRRAFQFSSQHGEDGVLLAILDHLGINRGESVEIGAGNNGGCTGLLAMVRDFEAVFIEQDAALADELKNNFKWNNVEILNTLVTPENINFLIQPSVNVISCDIDSIDYWVLKALKVSADVIVAEYNASLGPNLSATVPRNYLEIEITDELKRSQFYGCSLVALTTLFESKEMSLIYCDNSGTNAFFVSNRYKTLFEKLDPEAAYRTSNKSRLASARGYTPEFMIDNFPWEKL